jgi:hypothetical protein
MLVSFHYSVLRQQRWINDVLAIVSSLETPSRIGSASARMKFPG